MAVSPTTDGVAVMQGALAPAVAVGPRPVTFASVTVVIPCYNEAGGLESLRERLAPVTQELGRQTQLDIVFVDDGSIDTTYQELNSLLGDLPGAKVQILKHEVNRGL